MVRSTFVDFYVLYRFAMLNIHRIKKQNTMTILAHYTRIPSFISVMKIAYITNKNKVLLQPSISFELIFIIRTFIAAISVVEAHVFR